MTSLVRVYWNLCRAMEHYTKKKSCFIDEELRENEIRVSSSGKPHDLATRLQHMLQEFPERGVVVSASGCHVTKAVTVAEILKQRQKNLQQVTEIKYVRVEDIWEPDQPQLDELKVTRRIPAIAISLVPSPVKKTQAEGVAAAGERTKTKH